MIRPMPHHRKPEFRAILLEAREGLKKVFKTNNDIVILTASGTGAMEAAVGNLLSPETPALAVSAGKFGERWLEICSAFRIPCRAITKNYGEAASVEEIRQTIEQSPDTRALLIQGCETSTGTAHDLEAIGEMIRTSFPEVLIVVDAITCVGSQPLETDAWGLDVVIGGSQKAFAIPPGLSFLSLSERAIATIKSNSTPRYYFDLLKEVEAQRGGQTALTPAVSLVIALNEALREILNQGLDRVMDEVELMAQCTREGVLAMGFSLVSSVPAPAVTAFYPPSSISAAAIIQRLQERFGIIVAGGQGDLKGKILRIGHLGYFDLIDVLSVLSALEICLLELGSKIELGSGIGAAMRRIASPPKPAVS